MTEPDFSEYLDGYNEWINNYCPFCSRLVISPLGWCEWCGLDLERFYSCNVYEFFSDKNDLEND